jgi:outer membrane cobalamin receptor
VELEVQFIGFLNKTVKVSPSQDRMDVVLETDINLMDEVVVTAFATQKKVNVTGAISSVNGSDILSVPVSNISNALIGNTPGVSGLQTSGEPGRNAANLYIRGVST